MATDATSDATWQAKVQAQTRRRSKAAAPARRKKKARSNDQAFITAAYVFAIVVLSVYIVFLTTEIASGSGTGGTLIAMAGIMLAGGLAAALGASTGKRDLRR